MRLTPKQADAVAALINRYGNAGSAVTITRGEGRSVHVKFDAGTEYDIGGRGVISEQA